MTPLEAMQRIVARGPFVNDTCLWCTYTPVNTGRHADDCPSLSLPKIAATLEDHEALVAALVAGEPVSVWAKKPGLRAVPAPSKDTP